MNEKLDLTKILKDCPKGTKLWHTVYGEVEFNNISNNVETDKPYLIFFTKRGNTIGSVTTDGRMSERYDGECVLFPSKDQRDWSKFKAPNKKVKVILHPFDKVLERTGENRKWEASLISDFDKTDGEEPYFCLGFWRPCCIPYNKDTAYLVGTNLECPIDYEIEFSKEYKE